jgi:hypothetical protein
MVLLSPHHKPGTARKQASITMEVARQIMIVARRQAYF